MQNQAIGIFDSGIGGLTVFKEIAQTLPFEDLIYLGDTARVPYGTKSADTVVRYASQNVNFLLQKNVKAIVVACNTASAFALDHLQKNHQFPILGVIEPGVKGALRASKTFRVGIIGTEGTIASGAYAKTIEKEKPGTFTSSQACPLFVPLVEEGWWDGDITETIAKKYLATLFAKNIDSLILGCTHYPLLKETIGKIAGPQIELIDSAQETAREVRRQLQEKDLLRKENPHPKREFFVTDSPERFRKLGKLFLKQELKDVQHVEI